MRVLVLNANTNAAMTEHAVVHARRLAPDIEFVGATGRFGSRHIGTRATYAIASHAAVDCLAAQTETYDAVILACFGDPGLGALRDLAGVPVFGLAESAARMAAGYKQPFSIVTGGQRWIGILREYLAGIGLDEHLASIRTVSVTGSQILADPQSSLDALAQECHRAAQEDGAERVILGGAGLIGLACDVGKRADMAVMDCLEPAIADVRAISLAPARRGQPDTNSKIDGDFSGLPASLATLLSTDTAKGP